jgi:hypothetical protein
MLSTQSPASDTSFEPVEAVVILATVCSRSNQETYNLDLEPETEVVVPVIVVLMSVSMIYGVATIGGVVAMIQQYLYLFDC